MSIQNRSKNARAVVALVATRGRNDLLRRRALPSVLAQSRPPDRLFVVVDQDKNELSNADLKELAEALQRKCGKAFPVTVLRNRRTPRRAAGAWNSGIDQLHRDSRIMNRADLWYAAVLDDDDAWEPRHLEQCLEEAESGNQGMVAAGLIRHDSPEDAGKRQSIPVELDAREQFIRGQHIQGSNLFVRLDALLKVGMFDEHLPSCTDRDLCIRLSRLPGFRFGSVQDHTVHHYADARADRLSAPGSPAKLDGLTRFWFKHADRFDAAARADAAERARTLFGWTLPDLKVEIVDVPPATAVVERVSIVVGFVTDSVPPQHAHGLLDDLVTLKDDPGVSALRVVVVENGPMPQGSERPLHALTAAYGYRGLDIELVTLERQREDWAQGHLMDTPDPTRHRLKIAVSRTVLNTYLARAAAEHTGSWAWVLDDDKRLTMLVDRGNGATVERPSPDVAALCALRDWGANIVIGPDTDAAPLPFTATLRVQLVDLEHMLGVLEHLKPTDHWPNRSAWTRDAKTRLRDSYYDLSKSTEHLETPFAFAVPGTAASAAQALMTVAARVGRLLAGEAVFRPLTVEVNQLPVDAAVPSVQRGGSTIFFDPRVLLEYPQNMARFADTYVRRSDMLITGLQRDQLGLNVVMHPAAAVRHDRSDTKRAKLDNQVLTEDVLGFALYRTANDLLQGRTPARRREPLLAWSGAELTEACRLVGKNITERLAAFTLNGWRIAPLAEAAKATARRLLADPSWNGEVSRAHLQTIVKEMDRIEGQYLPSAVAEYAERIRKSVSDKDVRNTFSSMDGLISEYRSTVSKQYTTDARVQAARERRARALLKKAWSVDTLRLLGSGGEGMVFTDEQRVYKVFDLLKKRPNHDTLETLQVLRNRMETPKHLYALSRVEMRDETLLIAYPLESSEPYTGGRGPELIALLRECKANGVVFRNMHPKNLRVTPSGLKLIDYGSDIRPFSDGGYRSMAERAWLTWRWPHRPDLDEVMRRALADKALPELDGFDRFLTALLDEKPSATRMVAGLVDSIVLEGGAKSVLDYGCGKKARNARQLADAGLRCVGYDPGPGMPERWTALPSIPGLTLTTDREAAISKGPYDAVVCSLVLCELGDGPEYERVLSDLRRAVAEQGTLVISVCDPLATFGGPTNLHSRRDLPPGAAYEECFWYVENAETGVGRREFHRPLRRIERDLLRHGIRVERRIWNHAVDLERFEPATDVVALVCRPVMLERPEPRVSLLVKTCAMEAHTIERQVAHLVGQLEGPRIFHERVLAIDSRRDGFVRQHADADPEAVREAARRLVRRGFIDRVVYGPESGPESQRINREWFNLDCDATHTAAGAPLAMPLHAFEACTGEYILQVDSDLLVGRRDVTHDYLGEMMAELEVRPSAVCASLNIPRQEPLPFTTDEDGCPWRVEVRGCLLHKARLLAARPLTNHVEDGLPALSWHRSLDASIQAERLESLRGGGNHTYFIHPPNDLKQSVGDWMLILDLVEKGQLPEEQVGHVDLVGGPLLWVPDERSEPLVFVITGRNVPPGRALRCLTSLAAQSRTDWGAVIVDDGSSEWSREHLRLSVAPLKDRVTLLQPRERRGQLANTALAIRHVCTDPDSVIVTLDLDDALLGPGVADRILAEHRRGTDVTVGTMLRTDKHAEYPVTFDNPRQSRGGNVWQHLRSFRKYLFDAIPDHDLRIDGSYVDIAVDWAFMLPIVELAEHPVWIREPLYLYEPSGLGKGPSREERERQIAAVVSRPPRTRSGRDSKSLLLTPEDLVREGWRTDSGILFIRHGERPSFKGLNADERDAMRLTENGRAAARVLGQHLGSDTGIASSPVPRARETAECLAEGAGGAPAPIRVMEQLVDFRVTDPETYESFKRRLGWAGLMMAWTDGSLPSGVLIPCDQVACAAVRGVLGHSGCQRSIAVTHDFLIIALLATLYGVRQTAIPYLGGLFLSEAQADLLVNKETHP